MSDDKKQNKKEENNFNPVPSIDKSQDQKPTTENKRTRPKRLLGKKNLTIIFTGLIFIATTIYTIFSALQWSAMRDAIDRADSSNVYTRRSLDLADSMNAHTITSLAQSDSSINLSKKIAYIQEKYAKIEARAYLNVTEIRDFKIIVGKPLQYTLIVTNNGKTPAYHIRGVTAYKIGTGIYPPEIKQIDDAPLAYYGSTLGAYQTSMKGPDPRDTAIIMKEDSVTIYEGVFTLFIYGKLLYQDAFGDEHFTMFASFYDPKTTKIWSYYYYNDAN